MQLFFFFFSVNKSKITFAKRQWMYSNRVNIPPRKIVWNTNKDSCGYVQGIWLNYATLKASDGIMQQMLRFVLKDFPLFVMLKCERTLPGFNSSWRPESGWHTDTLLLPPLPTATSEPPPNWGQATWSAGRYEGARATGIFQTLPQQKPLWTVLFVCLFFVFYLGGGGCIMRKHSLCYARTPLLQKSFPSKKY